MINSIIPVSFKITDDSGFVALVNSQKYRSFISGDWTFEQIKNRFIEEMNNRAIIIWSTGSEEIWNISVVDTSSQNAAIRQFESIIEVTDGQLFLTNYEDLTFAAQYSDLKIPTHHNSALCIKLTNGVYNVLVQQFSLAKDNHATTTTDFEIVITPSRSSEVKNEIENIFWLEK